MLCGQTRFFAGSLILIGAAETDLQARCDKITSPRSRIEAHPLFCPISSGGDPEALRPCPRQTRDRRQSVDRISALVCLLFRSSSPSFVAS